MKVLCKRATTRLVKGATYEVLSLHNFPQSRGNQSGYLRIKQGRFAVTGFTKLDGSLLDEIFWESEETKSTKNQWKDCNIQDVRILKKDDVVVCQYSTKLFEEGKKYKVDDISYKETPSRWGGVNKDQKIKIQGDTRWISNYRFRLCTPQEKRAMSLSNIFDETPVDIMNMKEIKSTRKILRLSERDRNRIILSCILSSVVDPNKNNLSTIDWAIEKKGKQYDIILSDIKPFLNKRLSDIIKLCE